MATPEGKVKNAVKKVLTDSKHAGYIYSNWPVPTGFGTPMLDCVGCYFGHFFAIETKAPRKKPTKRQQLCIEQMTAAGATVFVIDGPDTLKLLEDWLNAVASRYGKGINRTQDAGHTE